MSSEKPQGVDMLFPTAIKAVLRILEHNSIMACLVGELALNYYNVPDVVHDVEVCVPDDVMDNAQLVLRDTGLFEIQDYVDINAHNEYKSCFSRLQTTGWLPRPVSFVILPTSFCGLQPLDTCAFRPCANTIPESEFSKEILEAVGEEDVATFPFPCLAPFIAGLVQRYLETSDDMAAVAVEHLVDGLDLSEAWCNQHLSATSSEVKEFVDRLIRGKKSRIAYYQDNEVTCMIANEEQARRLFRIPGYQ